MKEYLIADDETHAIKDLRSILDKISPEAEIYEALSVDEAYETVKEHAIDVAFLDVKFPGESGIALAHRLRKLRPRLNVIMVTAYPQYAVESYSFLASGYILKPALEEEVREALANLRNPIVEDHPGLYVQCFGNFEVFYDGKPIRFSRNRSKEMFAYLVDRRGAVVTNAQLREILWEDQSQDPKRQRDQIAHFAQDIRRTLDELDCGGAFVQSHNAYSVNRESFTCDYYRALDHEPGILTSFQGEYMSQYSWAEVSVGSILEAGDRYLKDQR